MYKRKELSYQLNDLQPFIDTKTMNEHFNVHYKKYTENLNKALFENEIVTDGTIPSLISVLRNYENYPIVIRNNGGGYLNHLMYFDNISPYNNDYETYASDELKSMIERGFGSYQNFEDNFKKAGKSVFGSGWAWLVLSGNKLLILTTANQDNPLMEMDAKILLGMDVWEHAYYLKHMADRDAYMDDFFRTIDWSVVSNRL
jgi:Fe-Mn family superoxide dismutase